MRYYGEVLKINAAKHDQWYPPSDPVVSKKTMQFVNCANALARKADNDVSFPQPCCFCRALRVDVGGHDSRGGRKPVLVHEPAQQRNILCRNADPAPPHASVQKNLTGNVLRRVDAIRYSLLLCEKVLKASFAAPIAFRVSISSAMVTLPIILLSVGFTRSTTWVPWRVTNWPLI